MSISLLCANRKQHSNKTDAFNAWGKELGYQQQQPLYTGPFSRDGPNAPVLGIPLQCQQPACSRQRLTIARMYQKSRTPPNI